MAVSIEWSQTTPVAPTYNAETILESCSNLLVEANYYVRPIHSSVREFLTSPSQREINYIHADLILNTDPRFTFLSQTESEHIRKNICFERVSCESKIALACLKYFTTKDILAELSKGPSKSWQQHWRRAKDLCLLMYCSCYFDKHIYNMQVLTDEVIDTLESFLSIDNKALALILQIRLRKRGQYESMTSRLQVNARTMIFATALFSLPHLHKERWMKQEDTESLLHTATISGSLEAVEHLIRSGISINGRDGNNSTALHYASESGHYDICNLLLQNSFDVNLKGGAYGYALQAASAKGHDNIVQLLLTQDADINLTGG